VKASAGRRPGRGLGTGGRQPRQARAWARRAVAVAVALLVDRTLTHRRLVACEARVGALREELAEQLRQSDRLTEQLRAEARTDPLTGLGNRRQWQEQVGRELERARRMGSGLAVAVVDLDRFKDVNDSRGHAAGDEVLRDVGARFVQSVRTIDLVARIGGEEFAVALPDVSLTDAVSILERLRTSLVPMVTCSVGLAMWDGQETIEALEGRADRALYRAKTAGRDRLVVA